MVYFVFRYIWYSSKSTLIIYKAPTSAVVSVRNRMHAWFAEFKSRQMVIFDLHFQSSMDIRQGYINGYKTRIYYFK